MNRPTKIIAIDPDVDKNGVAILEKETKTLKIYSLSFAEIIDMVLSLKGSPTPVLVIVEGGWLNSSNWHLRNGDSKRVAAAKGRNLGANHETGKKIVEVCEYYSIPVKVVRPLRKIWKNGKISHEELSKFAPIPSRTNQEERDACLICLNYAGMPIKIKR